MSTGPSRSGSPIRQQLDELNALLERMLDQPGRHGEERNASRRNAPEQEPPEQGPPERPERPAEPPSLLSSYGGAVPPEPRPDAEGTLSEQPPPAGAGADRDDEWVPLRPQGWQPSAHTWGPLADSWLKGQVGPPTPEGPNVAPEGPETPLPEVAPPPSAGDPGVEERLERPDARESWPSPPEPPLSQPEQGMSGEERPGPPEGFPARDSLPPTYHPLEPAAREGPPPLPTWESGQPGGPALFPPRTQAPFTPPAPAPPREGTGPPPGWLGPLVWFNQGFEAAAHSLGPPGRWLTSPSGRTVLGTAGLFALAIALIALLLQGIAWTG